MKHSFIGRKYELERLGKLLKKRVASLVVIKGRRRIGKSRLIETFSREHTFFRFSAYHQIAIQQINLNSMNLLTK